MRYIRFTCEKCGMIINKGESQSEMNCPHGDGLMKKKQWGEIGFYLTTLLILFFLTLIFLIIKINY